MCTKENTTTCSPAVLPSARHTLPFKFRKVQFRERDNKSNLNKTTRKLGPSPHPFQHTMGQNGSKKPSKAADEPNHHHHHHHHTTLNRSPSNKSVVVSSSSSGRVDLGSSSGRSRTRANSTVSSLSTAGPSSSMKRAVSPRTPKGRDEEIYNIEQRIKKRLVMDNHHKNKNQQRSSPSRFAKEVQSNNTSWVC